MKQLLKIRLLFLIWTCAIMGMAFAGCQDDKDEPTDEILRPIAEHIIGKWSLDKAFKLQEDGQWAQEPDVEGFETIYTFRKNGDVVIAMTYEDGQTLTYVIDWTTDEKQNFLIMDGKDFKMLSLDENFFEMGFNQAMDIEGEMKDGEYKWLLTRAPETAKTLSQLLVGKWNFSKRYQKQDGGWVATSLGQPDESRHEYEENCNCTIYSRTGEKETVHRDMAWSVNNKTGKLWYWNAEEAYTLNVAIEADGTLSVFYNEVTDPETGETVTGEFKDVFVRE